MIGSHDSSNVSLLDLLIDGFEKNEVLDGFHWRILPMPDETAARDKFESLGGCRLPRIALAAMLTQVLPHEGSASEPGGV